MFRLIYLLSIALCLNPILVKAESLWTAKDVQDAVSKISSAEDRNEIEAIFEVNDLPGLMLFLSDGNLNHEESTHNLMIAIAKNTSDPTDRVILLSGSREMNGGRGFRGEKAVQLMRLFASDHRRSEKSPGQGVHREQRVSELVMSATYDAFFDESEGALADEHRAFLSAHAVHLAENADTENYVEGLEFEILMRGFAKHAKRKPREALLEMAKIGMSHKMAGRNAINKLFEVCSDSIRLKERNRGTLEVCRSQEFGDKLVEFSSLYEGQAGKTADKTTAERTNRLLAKIRLDEESDSLNETLDAAISSMWESWDGSSKLGTIDPYLPPSFDLKQIFANALFDKDASELTADEISEVFVVMNAAGGANYLSGIGMAISHLPGVNKGAYLTNRIVLKAAHRRLKASDFRDATEKIHAAVGAN